MHSWAGRLPTCVVCFHKWHSWNHVRALLVYGEALRLMKPVCPGDGDPWPMGFFREACVGWLALGLGANRTRLINKSPTRTEHIAVSNCARRNIEASIADKWAPRFCAWCACVWKVWERARPGRHPSANWKLVLNGKRNFDMPAQIYAFNLWIYWN